jgi:hypothetical protein
LFALLAISLAGLFIAMFMGFMAPHERRTFLAEVIPWMRTVSGQIAIIVGKTFKVSFILLVVFIVLALIVSFALSFGQWILIGIAIGIGLFIVFAILAAIAG